MMALNKTKLTIAAALAMALAVTGCATRLEEKESLAKQVAAEAKTRQTMTGGELPTALSTGSAVSRDGGVWIPVKPVKVSKREDVPEILKKKIAIDRDILSISEIAERVTSTTGVVVSVAPDLASMQAPGLNPFGQAGMPAGMAGNLAQPPLPGGMAGMQSSMGMPGMPGMMQQQKVTISYSGPVTGLLDVAAARWGATWDFRDGRVYLYRLVTKSFVIHAVPGNATSTAQIGASSTTATGTSSSGSSGTASTSSGSSGSSSTQQQTQTQATLSVWNGVEEAVKSMLSAGGKVAISPATGTLTVTDIPDTLARVEEYVKKQNEALARQVFVNVQVYTVRLSDEDQYGIDWSLVYKALSGNFGWSLANLTSLVTDTAASNLKMQVLDTAGANGAQIGAWKGSNAVIKAISSQGTVSTVTTATVHTLNNQPVPLQRVSQTGYLQSSSTTQSPNVGSTTALTPGTVVTGFSMNVLPHILEGGRILLQFSVDLSKLERMMTVTSGGSSIQTPEVSSMSFLQRVALRSGQTLVLTGFENANTAMEREGVGQPQNWLLGGGVSGQKNRDIVVMILTPIVADRTI